MSSVGEWGQEDREREPSEFEKENPDILLLNGTGEFKDMQMQMKEFHFCIFVSQ